MANSQPNMAARALGHLIFWSPGIFITICIVVSIGIDLYGQPPKVDGAQKAWCLREALSLRDELRGQVSLALGPTVSAKARESWRTFESDYETRLESAATRCRDSDREREAFDQLRDVFQSYREITQGNHEVIEGAQSDLDRAIQQLGGPRAPVQ